MKPLIREIPMELQESKDNGEVVGYLSTGSRDSYGTILDPAGWMRESMDMAIGQWNHGFDTLFTGDMGFWAGLPVIRHIKMWTDSQGLVSHYRYLLDAPGKLGELTKTLYYLAREGAMAGHSVHFDPLAGRMPDGKEWERDFGDPYVREVPGMTYTRMWLREGGPVIIGANKDANAIVVRRMRSIGLDIPDIPEVEDVPASMLPERDDLADGLRHALASIRQEQAAKDFARSLRTLCATREG